MGYEVVPATGNFFYSHAFEFYMSEPFTHTGVLLEQKVADDITVLGGWTAGWDTGFDRNGGSTFIGGVKLQLTEKAAFSYMTSWGDVGYDTTYRTRQRHEWLLPHAAVHLEPYRPLDLRVPEQPGRQRPAVLVPPKTRSA